MVYNSETTEQCNSSKEVRDPTANDMDRSKTEMRRVRQEKKKDDQRRESLSLRRKKIQVRKKVKKVATDCVLSNALWLGGFKSRLAKAAGGLSTLCYAS